MSEVKLSTLIAPSFVPVHRAIRQGAYTHFWLSGGRGSTKSSFASIEMILEILRDPEANGVVLRKVGNTLKDSVFNQLAWAVEVLGIGHLWHVPQAKLEMTYLPTGQKILFRGGDDPQKIKSVKFTRGYAKMIWFEELNQFSGDEEIRSINQSLMRGGDRFVVFYTYNPPERQRSWVNLEAMRTREDRLNHHSSYLSVPEKWLGRPFIVEAEHLKKVNPKKYLHEYMGLVTGTGGEVFTNVTSRRITDGEIADFDRIYRGVDHGYARDPFHYTEMYFDRTRRRLFIFHEFRGVELKLREISAHLKARPYKEVITADTNDARANAALKRDGLPIRNAIKGRDSVEYGVKFLQDLEEIVIDPVRCPGTWDEFLNYELEKDGDGNYKGTFPDKNNHSIDAVRYALNSEIRGEVFSFD